MLRNNLIVLLLAAAGLFSSCEEGNHYSLTGNLPARYDGCLVKLTPATFYFSKEKTCPVDSIKIQDGKFRFDGTVQKPTVYVVTIDDVDYQIPDMGSMTVVIEPGDITMVYDTLGIIVSGTPVNERYMATIGEAKRETVRQRQLLWQERDSVKRLPGSVENEVDTYYNQKSSTIFKENIIPASENFIREYRGTEIGEFFFFHCCGMDAYSKAFVDKIYPTIRPEIREQYEALIRARQEKQDYFMYSQKATKVGMPYREVVARTPEGEEIRLSDYIGKKQLVLLDFWASWCIPCIQEIPLLKKVQEKYEHQGLQIVGVSVDSDREKWEGALDKHHPAGIQISELKGWESTSRVDYGVQAIPFTVLIDTSGKIHARNPHGPLLEEIIEKYFSRK